MSRSLTHQYPSTSISFKYGSGKSSTTTVLSVLASLIEYLVSFRRILVPIRCPQPTHSFRLSSKSQFDRSITITAQQRVQYPISRPHTLLIQRKSASRHFYRDNSTSVPQLPLRNEYEHAQQNKCTFFIYIASSKTSVWTFFFSTAGP